MDSLLPIGAQTQSLPSAHTRKNPGYLLTSFIMNSDVLQREDVSSAGTPMLSAQRMAKPPKTCCTKSLPLLQGPLVRKTLMKPAKTDPAVPETAAINLIKWRAKVKVGSGNNKCLRERGRSEQAEKNALGRE
ncbi:hypothetical protein PoB_003409400 [Plakobranchus ocellatus]|uniref:Uncharacterized protein n=1 Tax=Plakobranchus ocellatus TaxID=259542 RepID=A0AAV4AN14_9GAST|nr:hypothetical protein PoB_003409400 [Plakobranchus ocellatus]